MSVMVIGGTGFIGAKIVKLLVEQGEDVVVVDLFPNFERVREVKDQITIIRGSITSIEGIIEVIKNNKVHKIINLAYHLDSESDQFPHEAIKVNARDQRYTNA